MRGRVYSKPLIAFRNERARSETRPAVECGHQASWQRSPFA
jgi:hypothetical protein